MVVFSAHGTGKFSVVQQVPPIHGVLEVLFWLRAHGSGKLSFALSLGVVVFRAHGTGKLS